METTRNNTTLRTIGNLVTLLDEQLARTAQETTITKIGLWTAIMKRSDESFRNFWLRWGKLTLSLMRSGMEFNNEIMYFRALAAINLKQPQLSILLGTMEARNFAQSIPELQRCTIKLFEASFIPANEDVLQVAEQEGEEFDEEDADLPDQNLADMFTGVDGEAYELKKARPKKNNKWGQSSHHGTMLDILTT